MKLNVKKFMKTEMGGELEETICTWNQAIIEAAKALHECGCMDVAYKDWKAVCNSCEDKWKVFKLAIKQFYGIEFFFTRTDTYYGVCTEDESVWLMKEMR